MRITSHLFSDLLWFLLVPPFGALSWLLLSGGLCRTLGTSDSKAVQGWTKSGFWILLAILYAVDFVGLIYKYFIRGA